MFSNAFGNINFSKGQGENLPKDLPNTLYRVYTSESVRHTRPQKLPPECALTFAPI